MLVPDVSTVKTCYPVSTIVSVSTNGWVAACHGLGPPEKLEGVAAGELYSVACTIAEMSHGGVSPFTIVHFPPKGY